MSTKIFVINKKTLITISVIVFAIIIAIIVAMVMPKFKVKNVVNNYAMALENKNTNELLNFIDFKGAIAWQSGFDKDNFSDSDYKDFINEYDNINVSTSNSAKETLKKYYEDFFNNGNYENINIEKTNKISKDLYSVVVYLYEGGDDWGRTRTSNIYCI